MQRIRHPYAARLSGSLLLLAAIALAGCGQSGPALAKVRGVITLDGQPLPGARIEFQPSAGSPSVATTDDRGAYVLRYTRDRNGALPGAHRVRISTFREVEDENGRVTVHPERLPPAYNIRTELSAEVKPGRNDLDFTLRSSQVAMSPGGSYGR